MLRPKYSILPYRTDLQTQIIIASLSHFPGLLRDDLLHENDDVKEALRRLPDHVVDERNFRLIRAMQLSLQKNILPKEEWTKLEEDTLYLTPIVEQVKKERAERENWDKDYWNVIMIYVIYCIF